jgi:sulfate permease, SulP family
LWRLFSFEKTKLFNRLNLDKDAMLSQFFPLLGYLKSYKYPLFSADAIAGIITAILLVPQGIAYAILAGLPPQHGLYASILPPIVYAILGSSQVLSVGPVSIAAIMVASALAAPEIAILHNPLQASLLLALESGLCMLFMAICRMGVLVNFISHPVLSGFTSGAALLIIASQLPELMGLKKPTCRLDDISCYQAYISGYSITTLCLGLAALAFLILLGHPITYFLKKARINPVISTGISKCGPLLVIILSTIVVKHFNWAVEQHIAIVGNVPSGLPKLSANFFDLVTAQVLLPYAVFISLIAYVESVAIAKVAANIRGEKIRPNQELVALGFANIAAACSGGMPVAGGFSRTMVSIAAGARTQMTMLVAAFILLVAVAYLTPWFTYIPKATLAAIILVAIWPLIHLKEIISTWRYDSGDGVSELITLLGVLMLGVEKGIVLGIILTIANHIRKSSRPHIAIVGRVPNTEHYRNIKRHSVETWQNLLLLRVDGDISFTNINYIEDYFFAELQQRPTIKHIVLIFTSINDIDTTALEALENINKTLQVAGKTLNIAEAKGPVLDKLAKTDFLRHLNPGKSFFRIEDAVKELAA